jgi:hypothetical protein
MIHLGNTSEDRTVVLGDTANVDEKVALDANLKRDSPDNLEATLLVSQPLGVLS